MFDLTTVWLLILIFLVFASFWQFRKFAETANRAAKDYCKRYQLQLLSVAQESWRIQCNKRGLHLVIHYEMNYSANGISANKGEVIISNGKIEQIHHWG